MAEHLMQPPTRSRIVDYLEKFRELGLIGLNEKRCLVVDRARLAAYLDTSRIKKEAQALEQPGAGAGI